jgi:hypothetical protein
MSTKFNIFPAKALQEIARPGQKPPNPNDSESRFITNL